MPNIITDNDRNIIKQEIDTLVSIFSTDINGNFLYVNENFCELSEYEENELIGKSSKIFKSGIHDKKFYNSFWTDLKEGKTWRGVFCNKTKSGKLFWFDTVIKPVFNKENKIEKFIGFRLNVTDSIQSKLALEAQSNHLMSISNLATVGEISSFVAHEINNPLTIMALTIDSLNAALNCDSPDIEKIKKLNLKMNNINDRMAKIVLALRNFSRKDSNAKMGFFKIKDILDDVILLTAGIAKSNGINLTIENDVDNNQLIQCYKIQISQVLINLVKNACDAVQDSETREVEIKIKTCSEILETRVINSGKKVSDELAALLFTPYYTTKSEGRGTGLGLTISTKIVKDHKGTLYLDKENDKTCFVMRVPCKQ